MQNKNTYKIDKSLASVPVWAKEAIFYQIFVERFRNGDSSKWKNQCNSEAGYRDRIKKESISDQ